MAKFLSKTVRALVGGTFAVVLGAVVTAGSLQAQQTDTKTTVVGEQYIPTIWVDPDGCEHWVMDDGVEGYMSPHVNRQGIPVCRRGNLCGVMNSDQYFASNAAHVSSAGKARLREFFRTTGARGYIIAGHTDSRASDAYNMKLSKQRARSVASIAKATGARIVDIRGYGERKPTASNKSAAGRAKNRRVEIICVR